MRRCFISGILLVAIIAFVFSSSVYAEKVLQTQQSSDGKVEASIIGAKARRGVLTVKISLTNVSNSKIEPEIRYGEFYYVNINENKKYYALKDSNGNYIAGPRHYDWGGGTFKWKINPSEKMMLWAKFPAPPPNTDTIDVFIPGILPFEEVAIDK